MAKKLQTHPTIAAICVATLIGGAVVSPSAAQSRNGNDGWVDIVSWDTEQLYAGWSAEELLDEEVYGENGETIGEVEDFIVGPDGKIAKVVVEGGGFLDIGDSHVAVPWSEVKRFGVSSIRVPMTEDNLDDYRLFEEVDDKPATGGNWRVRNLIGDYLTLADDVNYGYVVDVIFGSDNRIEAVVAQPAYGYGFGRGRHAFPYYAQNYDPYGPSYRTPYAKVQVEKLPALNYTRFDD